MTDVNVIYTHYYNRSIEGYNSETCYMVYGKAYTYLTLVRHNEPIFTHVNKVTHYGHNTTIEETIATFRNKKYYKR